jgi:hypothetical protein
MVYERKAPGPERTVLYSPSAYTSQGQAIRNALCVRRTSGDHAKKLGAWRTGSQLIQMDRREHDGEN